MTARSSAPAPIPPEAAFVAPPRAPRAVVVQTSIGAFGLVGEADTLVRLELPPLQPDWHEGIPAGTRADVAPSADQLEEYLEGARRTFSLALAPSGTAFQRSVWAALCSVPYGETASYGEIARRIGQPKAARAVGHANNHNPIAIVIPCHRVIGANGALVGYGGGLELKLRLLTLEASNAATDGTFRPVLPPRGTSG